MFLLIKIIRYTFYTLLFLSLFALGSIYAIYYYYSKDLPQLDSLKDYNPPVASEVFSADGVKIGEFWKEKRYLLSPEELPKALVQAIVASEDDRFFEHKGLDYQGILRAFYENFKAGRIVQGGSTLTQQVAKSMLLTSERAFDRKFREAILATKIEKNFSKNDILYLYLNQNYFGNRSYGVEAAAQNYFHKTARELNIAEAAMIAGLVKAPSAFSPLNNPERAKERQEYVIDRMYQVGFISEEEAQKAKAFEMKIFHASTDKNFNNDQYPWFTEHVRRVVQEKYGEQVPYTHGLKIITSLDTRLQDAADYAVDRGLRELDKRQGYSAVLRKVPESSISSFSKENHKKIMKEIEKEKALLLGPDFNGFANNETLTKTVIQENKLYQAVITALDKDKITIEIGYVPGVILKEDFQWARKRDLSIAAYEDVAYLKDPSLRFGVGDIILVRLKEASKKQSKSKKKIRERPLEFSLEQKIQAEAALFSYEPETGYVRAMVGGRDFQESEFNRATQALRQTGSVFKPLLYAAALDKGYSPSTIIEDSPLYYEYSPGQFWSPQNYGGGFKGPTSFRSALVNSRNVISVRLLMDIGIDYMVAYTRKLGITTPLKKYYPMALGSNDMKLMEISRAFGVFPTGGVLPELVFIKQITDRYGRILEENPPKAFTPFQEQMKTRADFVLEDIDPQFNLERSLADVQIRSDLIEDAKDWIEKDKLKLSDFEKQILYGDYIPEGYTISPKTAYTMTRLLNDVIKFGTGYKVRELKKEAAGKTGTTNDESDAWFLGFSPNLFAGVWVGFDQVKKLGGRETGGRTAAPIFLYYMQEALKDKEEKFKYPSEIQLSGFDLPLDRAFEDPEAGGINDMGAESDFYLYDF